MLPDLILVLRDGKVIESGTHDALLSEAASIHAWSITRWRRWRPRSFGRGCVAPKVFLKAMNTDKKDKHRWPVAHRRTPGPRSVFIPSYPCSSAFKILTVVPTH
jgi:hypothetical protein